MFRRPELDAMFGPLALMLGALFLLALWACQCAGLPMRRHAAVRIAAPRPRRRR